MGHNLKEIDIQEDFDELPVKKFSYAKVAPKNNHPKKKKSKSKYLLLAFTLILLIGISFYLYSEKHKSKITAENSKTKVVAPSFSNFNKANNYNSTGFGLSITLPAGWNVQSDDFNGIIIDSPLVELKNPDNTKQQYKVILTMALTGVVPASVSVHNPTAVIDSSKITFTNPSASQKAQSYLSFIRYSNESNQDSVNALFLTGNSDYQKNDTILSASLKRLNPTVFYSFVKCPSGNCSSSSSAINISNWSDKDFRNTLTKILCSISFS